MQQDSIFLQFSQSQVTIICISMFRPIHLTVIKICKSMSPSKQVEQAQCACNMHGQRFLPFCYIYACVAFDHSLDRTLGQVRDYWCEPGGRCGTVYQSTVQRLLVRPSSSDTLHYSHKTNNATGYVLSNRLICVHACSKRTSTKVSMRFLPAEPWDQNTLPDADMHFADNFVRIFHQNFRT